MPPTPTNIVVDNTMGCLFIGVVTAMGLWGAGTVQLYYYFSSYIHDHWALKSLVVLTWALDTVHQGMITHSAYVYLITNYAQPDFLNTIVPTLVYEVQVSALISALVQGFLISRAWGLSKGNKFLTGILALIVLVEFVLLSVYTGRALRIPTFTQLTSLVNLSRTINAFGAGTDLSIALVLIFLLNRNRTGFRRSETVINKLILFTLNTGLLTSVAALLSLITITTLPKSFVYILFYVNTSRLYTNSLLATLNARQKIRNVIDRDQTLSSIRLSKILGNNGNSNNGSGSGNRNRNRNRDRRRRQSALGVDSGSNMRFAPIKPTQSLPVSVNTETSQDLGEISKILPPQCAPTSTQTIDSKSGLDLGLYGYGYDGEFGREREREREREEGYGRYGGDAKHDKGDYEDKRGEIQGQGQSGGTGTGMVHDYAPINDHQDRNEDENDTNLVQARIGQSGSAV